MLCRGLTSTGVAGRPEEYFICGPFEDFPQGTRFWELGLFALGPAGPARERYLERVFRTGTTGNGVFGAKLMWNHLPCLFEKLRELPRFRDLDRAEVLHELLPELRIVHLVRRDRVGQAVSWSRAVQDGVWVTSDAEPPAPAAAPVYDYELIRSLERVLAEGALGWPLLFDELDVTPLTVQYEDLVDEDRYAGVIRAVLSYLGVDPPGVAIGPPGTLRQADALNDEWVQRYQAERATRDPRG